ncbi:MAG: hypothetical protein R3F41_19220 [Gammaproteobacteria bacterium]|nr:hypothetical protein [Pseudomonadales bacterium]MCP5346339.1 hypothetical protein [Pseudomonadales bacterium]
MNKREPLQSNADNPINIDEKLVEEGIAQLASEIRVLEDWLEELEHSETIDSEIMAARKSYHDMLRSRREMLSALHKHAGADIIHAKR